MTHQGICCYKGDRMSPTGPEPCSCIVVRGGLTSNGGNRGGSWSVQQVISWGLKYCLPPASLENRSSCLIGVLPWNQLVEQCPAATWEG